MDEYTSRPPSYSIEPPPQRRQTPSRVAAFVIAAVAVLAIGTLALLLVRANQDRTDLQASLNTSQAEVTRLGGEVATGAERRRELEEELSGTTDRLAAAQDELATANEELAAAAEVRDAVIDFFALSMTLGAGLTETQADCLAETLEADMGAADLLNATLAAADVGFNSGEFDSEMLSFGLAVVGAADDCGLDIGDLSAAAFSVGNSYGDNAALDSLWDSCAAGDLGSCDQLYSQSPVGSDYERFAATCGDRFTLQDAPLVCAEG